MLHLVYISPNPKDDELAHARTEERIKNPNWKRFLKDFQERYGDEFERFSVFSPTYEVDSHSEADMLSGLWGGSVYFQENHLERMMEQMRSIIGESQAVIVLDVGDSMSTLYAGYFCSQRGLPLLTAFHLNKTNNFAIGGMSQYAQNHPYLRRHLVKTIIERSLFVLVESEGIAKAIAGVLPRLDHSFTIDPISDQSENVTQEA